MSNVHVFENIGYQCNTEENIILKNVLPNYQGFKPENVDSYVPYLIRENTTKKYEVGIAQLKAGDTYYLVRERIIASSNSGQPISIKSGEFYIFANEYNFNTAFNNVVVKENNFIVDNNRAVYIVDTTIGDIRAELPSPQENPSLIVDFKIVNNTLGKLYLYQNNNLLFTINGYQSYATLASTGEKWILLQDQNKQKDDSFSSLDFAIQANAGGELGELQYNLDGTNLAGANVYFGTDNKLLFGANSEVNANVILPTSGDIAHNTIFNQQYSNSGNFIIYGSGVDKTFQFGSDGSIGVNIPSGYSIPTSGDIIFFGNQSGNRNLFFAYDGRLGINIPTGSRPQTLAHFVNFACDETIRVENKASCHTADITLHHAPAAQIIENDTNISTLTFSSKDSTQSKHTYARIYGKVLDYNSGSTSGELYLTVNSGNNLITTFTTNPKHTKISTQGSRSLLDLNDNAIGFSSENIVFSGNDISFVGADGASGSVNFNDAFIGSDLTVNNLKMSNIANTSILTVSGENVIAASVDNKISIIGVPSGRILTTTDNGIIETDLKISDLFQTNSDIVYSAYPKRLAEACLSQIIFDSDDLPALEEYSVNDQISIEYGDGQDTLYTTITSIVTNTTDEITILFTADQISPNTETGLQIQSISKGFILTLQKYVDPELSATNDATAIVLSTRPNEATVFNDNKKPIQFTVYTDSDLPGLDIRPSELLGNNITNGTYFKYSTQSDLLPLQTMISSGGSGAGINYNTANYDYAALGRWSGLFSIVGTNGKSSAYGTFDQNGNAAEFIANNSDEHRSTDNRYVAGGSIMTSGEQLNAFENIISTGVASGVGFRVASKYGVEDSSYITGILGLEFVDVGNPKNIAHNTGIIVYDRETEENQEIQVDNLGRVSYFYRIGKNEVTNHQYASFLNAVATGTDIFNLYNTQMYDSDIGGIEKSGISPPYLYIPKSGYEDQPVSFISYMSALRFSNWLNNGAPTGLTEDAANITELGAYNIQIDAGTTYIINKNQSSEYYIPDLNEWYKSAYFLPSESTKTNSNMVLINIDEPYPSAILTVNGKTHISGDLSVSGQAEFLGLNVETAEGNSILKLTNNSSADVSILQDTPNNSLALVDNENGRLTIGPNPTLQISTGDDNIWNGDYRTGFAPDKITLSADGPIKLISSEPVQMSGLSVTTLLTSELKITDPEGNIQDFISGPSGGILYKASSARASAIPRFSYVESEDQILFTGVSGLSPLYVNNLNYLDTYSNLTYNDDNIEVNTLLKINDRSNFQIGDDSEALKGAILVHQGVGPLKFELNKYLEAEGLTYDRFSKRLVEVDVQNKRVKFVQPDSSIGGIATDLPTLEDLDKEYSFGDTVAIMHTGDFEVEYVKLAAKLMGPFDGPDALYIEHPPIFEEDPDDNNAIFTHICPKIFANELDGEAGEDSPIFTGIIYSITQSSTLTNGLGYGLFTQDPPAISGFDCNISEVLPIDDPDATFSFRPSSKNVISTRPTIHTHFNAVGENIDFAIYGRTKTQYNRYIPSLHAADDDDGGLPLGLVPVFRVDANIPNAAIGNATGVFNSGFIDPLNTIPTGFILDDVGKVTINRDNPYVITSLNKSIDSVPSGYNTLDVLADLSVNGYTYSSGVIVDHIYLSGMHGTEYIPGATLTVDVNGKIISIAQDLPPSVPGPPLNVNGDAGNGAVFLRWRQPVDDGRSAIFDYKIEYSLNDGEIWTEVNDTISNDTSLTITGLVNDQRYIFRVAAINNIGQGQYSLPSAGITPTNNVPSAVATLNLTRSLVPGSDTNDRIYVNWSPPNDSGGSSITHYILKYRKTTENSFAGSRTIRLNVSEISLVDGSYTYELQELDYITVGPHILVEIFAVNSYGNGTVKRDVSLGTDPPPEPPPPPEDEYDFGEMNFNGDCTTT